MAKTAEDGKASALPRAVIVVPCYNEAARLDTARYKDAAVPDLDVEFSFVDDGSTDRTPDVLEALCRDAPERCSWMRLEPNQGKAAAVRQGVLAAAARRPDLVGFWDADLATPLEEIPRFCDDFRRHSELRLVTGARVRLLGRRIERRASRHYLGRIGATLIATAVGLAVYDTQCGAKLFRCDDALVKVFADPFVSRWLFDVEVLVRYVQLLCGPGGTTPDRIIHELPLDAWIDVAGSKVSGADFFRSLRDLWRIRARYRL